MISFWPLAATLGAIAVIACIWSWRRLDRSGRTVVLIFIASYVVTSVIGAIVIATHEGFIVWTLVSPGVDSSWLAPGSTGSYWVLLLGPLVLLCVVLPFFLRPMRALGRDMAMWLDGPVSVTAVVLAATALISYSVLGLASGGYLGTSLLSSDLSGDYRLNIMLRTDMAASLGTVHFAAVYCGLPALCHMAIYNAVRERSGKWLVVASLIGGTTVLLLFSTLTKANVLIFGIGVVAALATLRVIRGAMILAFLLAGVAVLAALEFLLSGADPANVALNASNVIFRVAASFPFYVEVFPDQVAHAGPLYGTFEIPPTQQVMNYMYPGITWIQGSASAPFHVAAYAQGGWIWSGLAVVMAAALLAAAAALGRYGRSPASFALFIGACVGAYYLSQADITGVLIHSYGIFWWLVVIVGVRFLDASLTAMSRAA